jgi:hypothetical protein
MNTENIENIGELEIIKVLKEKNIGKIKICNKFYEKEDEKTEIKIVEENEKFKESYKEIKSLIFMNGEENFNKKIDKIISLGHIPGSNNKSEKSLYGLINNYRQTLLGKGKSKIYPNFHPKIKNCSFLFEFFRQSLEFYETGKIESLSLDEINFNKKIDEIIALEHIPSYSIDSEKSLYKFINNYKQSLFGKGRYKIYSNSHPKIKNCLFLFEFFRQSFEFYENGKTESLSLDEINFNKKIDEIINLGHTPSYSIDSENHYMGLSIIIDELYLEGVVVKSIQILIQQ